MASTKRVRKLNIDTLNGLATRANAFTYVKCHDPTVCEYPELRLHKLTTTEIIVRIRGMCKQTFDIPNDIYAIPYSVNYCNTRRDVACSFPIDLNNYCDYSKSYNACDQECYYNADIDRYRYAHVLIFSDGTVEFSNISKMPDGPVPPTGRHTKAAPRDY